MAHSIPYLDTLVCVGDQLCAADQHHPGSGTYVKDGRVYAGRVGYARTLKDDGTGQTRIEVASHESEPTLPSTGKQVTVKVLRVAPNAVHTSILLVGTQVVEQKFTGTIRLQDVRAMEIDKVVLHECFRPGDIVRAEVLSLGDARSYYLTTAKNHLGVVFAKSMAGVAMVPIGWQEMQCPNTRVVERRKVAKLTE